MSVVANELRVCAKLHCRTELPLPNRIELPLAKLNCQTELPKTELRTELPNWN
jgi:hypothetical protein